MGGINGGNKTMRTQTRPHWMGRNINHDVSGGWVFLL
jgi:hypothetical protein